MGAFTAGESRWPSKVLVDREGMGEFEIAFETSRQQRADQTENENYVKKKKLLLATICETCAVEDGHTDVSALRI